MDFEALPGLTEAELKTFVIEYDKFLDAFNEYGGTVVDEANKLFSFCLNDNEKDALYEMLHGYTGWYYCKDGKYTNRLKITARSLRLTSNHYSTNELLQEDIKQVIRLISIEELNILRSAYVKQKLVTHKTLENNHLSKLEVFRGIKVFQPQYKSCNLESWSISEEKARKFGLNGYIIKITVPIEEIFVYTDSIYMSTSKKNYKANKYISTEEEYILESRERIVVLDEGINFVKYPNFFKKEEQ
jgi:hypothetical protein